MADAKSARADPAARAFYEPIARERDTSVYCLAISDFRSLPSIQPLDLSEYEGKVGDKITIRAVDVIGLAHVDVNIFAQDEMPIESGKAVETGVRSGKWSYTATQPVALGTDVFIEVKGVDHAGNEAKLTENPTVGMDNIALRRAAS